MAEHFYFNSYKLKCRLEKEAFQAHEPWFHTCFGMSLYQSKSSEEIKATLISTEEIKYKDLLIRY